MVGAQLEPTSSRCRPGDDPQGEVDTAQHGAADAAAAPQDGDAYNSSFERKLRRAKRAARSELSLSRGEWRKHGYAARPDLLQTAGLVDTLPRVDARSLTRERFAEEWERPRRPCMLTGLCDGWRAQHEWTPDRLLQRLGHCRLKVRPCRGLRGAACCWAALAVFSSVEGSRPVHFAGLPLSNTTSLPL